MKKVSSYSVEERRGRTFDYPIGQWDDQGVVRFNMCEFRKCYGDDPTGAYWRDIGRMLDDGTYIPPDWDFRIELAAQHRLQVFTSWGVQQHTRAIAGGSDCEDLGRHPKAQLARERETLRRI